MIRKIAILLSIIYFPILLAAQQTPSKRDSTWYPEVQFINGFVVDHSGSMAFAIKKPAHSMQINMLRPSNGRKYWQQYYNYPITGFGYYFADLGSPQILGYSTALYGIVQFPLLSNNWLSLRFNSEVGLSYFNKIFNAQNNIYNPAMGSHINSYFDFSFSLNYKIYHRIYIGQSFGLTHSSNGRLDTPNLGLNLLTFRFAISRLSYSTPFENTVKNIPLDKKWQYNLITSFALRERDYPGIKKYYVQSLMFNAEKPVNAKGNLNMGLDFFYDTSISQTYIKDTITTNITFFDQTYAGVHLGYAVVFGNVHVIIQQGFKFFSNEPSPQILYQRIGANYAIGKYLMMNFALRTYFAKADFIELGIGYRW
jgi:hypothetical protein